MTGWLIGSGCVLVIVGGTLGARWAGWRWHGWRLRRVHAQHAGPAEVAEAGDAFSRAFYGAMTLDDEREWRYGTVTLEPREYGPDERAPAPAFLPAAPDWREQTMAELGALGTDPGPGPAVSSAPGPDPELMAVLGGPGPRESRSVAIRQQGAYDVAAPAPSRLAHTGDIHGARLDLGPRAAAVLERYEQRRQERWALA